MEQHYASAIFRLQRYEGVPYAACLAFQRPCSLALSLSWLTKIASERGLRVHGGPKLLGGDLS